MRQVLVFHERAEALKAERVPDVDALLTLTKHRLFTEWIVNGGGAEYIRTAYGQWLANQVVELEADAAKAQARLVTELATDAPETLRAALDLADAKIAGTGGVVHK
jgi:hypothetical protein